MDFMEMLDHHKKMGADISIATIPVNDKDASDFGIMKMDESGFITSFTEKPKRDAPALDQRHRPYDAGAGPALPGFHGYLYLQPAAADRPLQNEYVESTDFGKEIIPQSLEKYKVVSYQYEGYWTDIGNIPSFSKPTSG
jgi:glucose-1-phosphate adenylyltransferase